MKDNIFSPDSNTELPPDPHFTSIFALVKFQDAVKAHSTITRLGKDNLTHKWLAKILPYLAVAMADTGNPDQVLASLDRFLKTTLDPLDILQELEKNPRKIDILVRLFAGSQFLTDILLRYPEYLSNLTNLDATSILKSSAVYLQDARQAIYELDDYPSQLDALRNYQRLELLKIGTADLLGLLDLTTVTRQLSNLADGLVQTCLEIASRQINRNYAGFLVLGLGKLGGNELNYSSDIDLLFISEGDTSEYIRLGEHLIRNISSITNEGFLYRVDMRLRPWGSVGSLVSSLKGYLNYLEKHARLWEKQALLKARGIAGDLNLEKKLLDSISGYIYNLPKDSVRSSVYQMKLQTEIQLLIKGHDRGEVKLGEGSIRDIEFVVQFLQMTHGHIDPSVLSRNTLESLIKLRQANLLSNKESLILTEGYVFLRTIEHHLQLMDYQQTHRLPTQVEAINNLSRRLGFTGINAGELFTAQYLQHSLAIRSIFLKYIGNSIMQPEAENMDSKPVDLSTVNMHLIRMDPSYAATFSPEEINRHALLADQLDNEHLVEIETDQLEDGRWKVTIVAYDYLGELSLICGLMFVYHLNIHGGEVFTYETLNNAKQVNIASPQPTETRRKIVDVFVVQPEKQDFTAELWGLYKEDLSSLLRLMHTGQRREARGQLASQVATMLHENAGTLTPLYPIEIEIDNQSSDKYTILNIESIDTIGFLYELTNALAYSRIYIARVVIDSIGNRVRDVLYVTDDLGQKIISPDRLRQLRAAIVLIKHFTHLLPHSPNPVSALLHFREFMAQLFEHPNWPDELASLSRPEVLDALARLLGVSDFLWDDFLRMQYANLFPVVRDVDALDSSKSRQQLQKELEKDLLPIHSHPQLPREDSPWIQVLNTFKDREMFRIDMRHILGHTQEFTEFSKELTDLAEVVINSAFHLTAEDLRSIYGTPQLENGQISQMAVVALGKCGGIELGFASDIELMFIYQGNGPTSGPEFISSAEFYEKVVQFFVQSIHARREGIFEVDLQLRPYGKAGSIAVSAESFKRYFGPGGPAWAYERQALVKLRPVAGDVEFGRHIVELRNEYIYTGAPFDVTSMRAMRERQLRFLVPAGTFHPKYSPGGLIDVEYLVQGLQITHGHTNPSLRVTNTREAMAALADSGILSMDDYSRIRKAHTFLRWLIDSLRVVRGNAKDVTIPSVKSEEFAYLARRLRFGGNVNQLQQDLFTHTANVLEINRRLLPG